MLWLLMFMGGRGRGRSRRNDFERGRRGRGALWRGFVVGFALGFVLLWALPMALLFESYL